MAAINSHVPCRSSSIIHPSHKHQSKLVTSHHEELVLPGTPRPRGDERCCTDGHDLQPELRGAKPATAAAADQSGQGVPAAVHPKDSTIHICDRGAGEQLPGDETTVLPAAGPDPRAVPVPGCQRRGTGHHAAAATITGFLPARGASSFSHHDGGAAHTAADVHRVRPAILHHHHHQPLQHR